jgi:hypothetical protein
MVAVDRAVQHQPFERPHFVVNARSPDARGAGRLDALRAATDRVFPGAGWSVTAARGDAIALARAAVVDVGSSLRPSLGCSRLSSKRPVTIR